MAASCPTLEPARGNGTRLCRATQVLRHAARRFSTIDLTPGRYHLRATTSFERSPSRSVSLFPPNDAPSSARSMCLFPEDHSDFLWRSFSASSAPLRLDGASAFVRASLCELCAFARGTVLCFVSSPKVEGRRTKVDGLCYSFSRSPVPTLHTLHPLHPLLTLSTFPRSHPSPPSHPCPASVTYRSVSRNSTAPH